MQFAHKAVSIVNTEDYSKHKDEDNTVNRRRQYLIATVTRTYEVCLVLDMLIRVEIYQNDAEDHGRKPVGESVPAEGW